MENKLYSDIESAIIGWTIDGTKTAGSLTREIMDILKNDEPTFISTSKFPDHKVKVGPKYPDKQHFGREEIEFIKRCIESHWELWNQTHEDNQKDWVISQNILNNGKEDIN